MLFGIGTRVKFLRTPDLGIITDKLGDGMVMVHLDVEDMEIPAFEEDLVREDVFLQNKQFESIKNEYPHLNKQKNADISKKKIISTNGIASSDTLPILSHSGVQLAFEPITRDDGVIEKFNILLLNDTPVDILYEFEMSFFNEPELTLDSKAQAVTFVDLGDILFDDINDAPEVTLSVAPIYTEGVGEKHFKTFKIKPKLFLKNTTFSTFINKAVYLFPIVIEWKNAERPADNLQKYTESILKAQKKSIKKEESTSPFSVLAEINEFATFVNEVDLHIELLHDNPQSLTNQEIIQIQLSAFERFLSKAIQLGVRKVFVIHGVGKGRLKELVHARLKRHSDVEYFKNEYHERYGWGATEIFL